MLYWQVFGSNTLEHCENPSDQTILTTGTADNFTTSGGKEFENMRKFYCYGLKMQQDPTKRYTGVKRLQFAIKGKKYYTVGFLDAFKGKKYFTVGFSDTS